MFARIRSLCMSLRIGFRSSTQLLRLAVGFGLAGLLLAAFHEFAGRFGMSLPMVTGCLVSVSAVVLRINVGRSCSLHHDCQPGAAAHRASQLLSSWPWRTLLLCAWLLLLPAFSDLVMLLLGSLPQSVATTTGGTILIGMIAGLPVVAIPLGLTMLCLGELQLSAIGNRRLADFERTAGSVPTSIATWLGMFTGIGVIACVLVPHFALNVTLLVACGVVTLASLVLRSSLSDPSVIDAATAIDTDHASRTVVRTSGLFVKSMAAPVSVSAFVLAILMGMSLAIVGRIASQLMPLTVYVPCAAGMGLILSGVAGHRWQWRRFSRRVMNPNNVTVVAQVSVSRFAMVVALWLIAVMAAFPQLVDLSLASTAAVHVVGQLMAIRMLLVAILVAPAGFAFGALLWRRRWSIPHTATDSVSTRGDTRFAVEPIIPAGLGGYLLARWTEAAGIHVSQSTFIVAWMLMLLAICEYAVNWRVTGRISSRLSRIVFAAGCVCVCAASFMMPRYDPARSARLLFSTGIFVGWKNGMPVESLEAMNDGRLRTSLAGPRGEMTLWRHRGVQAQIRENGVPIAMASTDSRICPQYSGEVAPTAVSMALHERAEQILLLGLGSGVPLRTALQFPVYQVVCVESDPGLLQLVRELNDEADVGNPLHDQRVELVTGEPILLLATEQRRFDTIVSNPGPAQLLASTVEYTQEFYRRAADRLEADGIFCQRFRQIDFGPQPILTLTATMKSVFRDVMTLEVGQGEAILLATNSPHGLIRDGLLHRLQNAHVRQVLATVNWDWTTPLSLAAIDTQELDSLLAKRTPVIHSAATATLAFRLPQESMRWAGKMKEMADTFGPHTSRMANRLPEEIVAAENVGARLTEVNERVELITGFPDEPWMYRRALKTRMTRNPRPPVESVIGGEIKREMHPDDQHRKAFVKALARAAADEHPRAEHIREVAEYSAPFDPLLSYFVHHEVADLLARSPNANPSAEFHHRLHAVYFADGVDQSVRNIIRAATLLMDNPTMIADAGDRWDHLNGLLEMLRLRWEHRGGNSPKSSQVTLNDIELTVSTLELGFDRLREWTADAGMDKTITDARCRMLETSLIRPLRTYRGQILSHRQNHQAGARLRSLAN